LLSVAVANTRCTSGTISTPCTPGIWSMTRTTWLVAVWTSMIWLAPKWTMDSRYAAGSMLAKSSREVSPGRGGGHCRQRQTVVRRPAANRCPAPK